MQVHPDDQYGLANEGEFGKTECWYVLSADEGAEIVFGHNATSKSEFRSMIEQNKWTELLRSVKVKAGDFFYFPSGTVHAIGQGVMVLETQQSSDTTYRLYDYYRKDNTGKPRELHIEKSIDVTTIPHVSEQSTPTVKEEGDSTLKTLVSNDFFTVYEWNIMTEVTFKQEGLYTLISVISGEDKMIVEDKEYTLNKGDHLILPHAIKEWSIDGEIQIIASHP